MKHASPVVLVGVVLFAISLSIGCGASPTQPSGGGRTSASTGGTGTGATFTGGDILIDASKDGGLWWFPQSGTYNAADKHQGKALVDYLRGRGYSVDEMPGGAPIQSSVLASYRVVIRAGTCGFYSSADFAAYDQFVAKSGALILLTDHMLGGCTEPDPLSIRYGNVTFIGSVGGHVDSFNPHQITAGVTSLPYGAGATILSSNPNKVDLLGFVGPSRTPVMGIIKGFAARIFFLGDTNGLETIPQPFTNNLLAWAFGS